MRIKVLLTILYVFMFNIIYAQNGIDYISREDLNKEFDFLVEAIKNTHPNPYQTISEKEFVQQTVTIKESFKDSLTTKEYYRVIAPFVASLNDGHTRLAFPGRKLLHSEDNLFPYIIKASIDSPFLKVTENIDNEFVQIPVGAEILKIGGISSEQIIQKIIDNTSGESKEYRLKMGADFNMFAFVFGTFYDLEEQVYVDYIYEGESISKKVPTVTLQRLMNIAKNRKADPVSSIAITNYTLSLIPEKSTAILDIRYLGEKKEFEQFLKESFKTINEAKIKKIVIDIRENGGGNSLLGDELLKYLSPTPFRQFDRTVVKYSQLQKEIYANRCQNNQQNCDLYNYINTKQNGELEILTVKDLVIPHLAEDRFQGKVYLLTSRRTFSSAMNLAQAFKYYKLGEIVGEETGGYLVSFGDLISINLPVTNWNFAISTKKFYTVGSKETDSHGVVPDIRINAINALDYAKKN
ncbi:hypothetical protein LNQ81_13725 [Myroides sp. M-43]|uniref:S41 family peptidase n=1 Tax=Myroides oncorhynchi TaxID=2893756 RepID=UPI001E59B1A6|nr:S41 family peptidase [Myroides oncorhynchi]MCC9043733.1 hypothetical protein [Myroides oncorhynchi]